MLDVPPVSLRSAVARKPIHQLLAVEIERPHTVMLGEERWMHLAETMEKRDRRTRKSGGNVRIVGLHEFPFGNWKLADLWITLAFFHKYNDTINPPK